MHPHYTRDQIDFSNFPKVRAIKASYNINNVPRPNPFDQASRPSYQNRRNFSRSTPQASSSLNRNRVPIQERLTLVDEWSSDVWQPFNDGMSFRPTSSRTVSTSSTRATQIEDRVVDEVHYNLPKVSFNSVPENYEDEMNYIENGRHTTNNSNNGAILAFFNAIGRDYNLKPVDSITKLMTAHLPRVCIELTSGINLLKSYTESELRGPVTIDPKFAFHGIGMMLIKKKDSEDYFSKLNYPKAIAGDEKELMKFLLVLLVLFNGRLPERTAQVISGLQPLTQDRINDILANFDINKDAFKGFDDKPQVYDYENFGDGLKMKSNVQLYTGSGATCTNVGLESSLDSREFCKSEIHAPSFLRFHKYGHGVLESPEYARFEPNQSAFKTPEEAGLQIKPPSLSSIFVESIPSPYTSDKEEGEFHPGKYEEYNPTPIDKRLEEDEHILGVPIETHLAQSDIDETQETSARSTGGTPEPQEIFQMDNFVEKFQSLNRIDSKVSMNVVENLEVIPEESIQSPFFNGHKSQAELDPSSGQVTPQLFSLHGVETVDNFEVYDEENMRTPSFIDYVDTPKSSNASYRKFRLAKFKLGGDDTHEEIDIEAENFSYGFDADPNEISVEALEAELPSSSSEDEE